jgi:hypothetical protein
VRYHVFIEGCRDATPAGMELLASALGQRYGMSPPAVVRRLKEGRFCARASLDLDSAQRLKAELETLGAHASLVGDGAPGSNAPRYESALAAAFAGDKLRDDVGMDLGALDGTARPGPDGGWQLASLDGSDDGGRGARPAVRPAATPSAGAATLPGWTSPPAGTGRVAVGEPPARAATPPPVPPTTKPGRGAPHDPPGGGARPVPAGSAKGPRDPFAPPDAGPQELPTLVDVPVREQSPAARPPVTTPPAIRRPVAITLQDPALRSTRARFAAGVAVAFLLGLAPAQLFAWSRADSAYADIEADLERDYRAADTPERWALLSEARADAVSVARSRQQRLIVSSYLLWLGAAAAVAFVWFRFIARAPASD